LKEFAGMSNKKEMGSTTFEDSESRKPDEVSKQEVKKMCEGLYWPSPSKAKQSTQQKQALNEEDNISPWWARNEPPDEVKMFANFMNTLIENSDNNGK
jgi:hypothetical protein